MNVLVTGGAGFIGSAVIRYLLQETDYSVVNVDKLTYAASLTSLASVDTSPRYAFEQADISDSQQIEAIFAQYRPSAVMHLAAESHVDRSIDAPDDFVQTNVVGTVRLLNAARRYFDGLAGAAKDAFRFHHISTDEVFGSLELVSPQFTESTPYDPRSPYSASKASADHFVRAWYHTYGLPVLVTNCTNNYGPYHFPEKLIPLVILKALEGESLPVYGKGDNIRDWLFVTDHAEALVRVVQFGKVGETYAISGRAERTNLEVVKAICDILDRIAPRLENGKRRCSLISHVQDRPGHDFRYAIDSSKIERELGWSPRHSFEAGLEETVRWFVDNRAWWEPLRKRYAGARLGTVNGARAKL